MALMNLKVLLEYRQTRAPQWKIIGVYYHESVAVFTYKLWTMSDDSGLDMVRSRPFTHVADVSTQQDIIHLRRDLTYWKYSVWLIRDVAPG